MKGLNRTSIVLAGVSTAVSVATLVISILTFRKSKKLDDIL